MPVTLRGAQTTVAGTLTGLNLFDFITGGASFALSSRAVDVDLDGDGSGLTGEQLDNANLLTIALSSLTLSVGISGVGLTLTGGSIGVAVLGAPVPATGTDTRSWTAVSADSLAVALDLPGITATVSNVALRIGRASGPEERDRGGAGELGHGRPDHQRAGRPRPGRWLHERVRTRESGRGPAGAGGPLDQAAR